MNLNKNQHEDVENNIKAIEKLSEDLEQLYKELELY